ncbi:Nn.00g076530.m01.CDS01 [Neocucurbitaria sp. VM-36]
MALFHNNKTITMLLDGNYYHATITSLMAPGDEIYNALRGAFIGKIDPSLSIIIWDPMRDEKVQLNYAKLKEHQAYRITAATERAQGVGPEASGGTYKTAKRLAAVMEHWSLSSTSQILPSEIAPRVLDGALQDPHYWPARLTDELQRLSSRSVDRHAVAMQYLAAAVQARQESESGGLWQVTSADVRAAVRKMTQSVADQAYGELPEEQADTRVYAGGLAEALEEDEDDGGDVEMGYAYEQDGKFTIGMR